jgi:hypothetical protein
MVLRFANSVLSPQSSVLTPCTPHPYPHFAASRCRLYCRFWMPLLVVVWQSKITVRYNTANQIADVEGIGELKLVSHYSLLTIHHSLFLAPRSLLPAPCFPLHASRSCYYLLLPVIAENLIQNCQLNQSVMRSAPVFALYLQELQ